MLQDGASFLVIYEDSDEDRISGESEVDSIRQSNAALIEAGWRLQAMPNENLETPLSDADFIRAAGLRLGLPLVFVGGSHVDCLALHRLRCCELASGQRWLLRARRHAGIASTKEPRIFR